MIKQNQKILNRFMVALDAVAIVFALVLSWYVRFNSHLFYIKPGGYLTLFDYTQYFWLIVPLFLFLFSMFRLYEPQRIKGFSTEFFNMAAAILIGETVFIMFLYVIKETEFSRQYLVIFYLLTLILCTIIRLSVRLTLKNIRKRGYNQKHVLLVGFSSLTVDFIEAITKNKHIGFKVLGILDDNRNPQIKVNSPTICTREGLVYLGKLMDIEKILKERHVDEVIITLHLSEYEKLEGVVSVCEKSGVKTSIIPDYFRIIPSRPFVDEIANLAIINIRYVPLENIGNKILKRFFDVGMSVLLMLLFLPLFLLIPILIKLSSPGPVFFAQDRIGYNRKRFKMYKYRSMKLQTQTDSQTKWTQAQDDRKTAFGSFLRKTSLDEIPQLWNVLKGDMSLVGPRPEREYYVERFRETIPKYMIKHQVRPGITGWAQIHGWRGDTSIERRIEFDLHYIENWSFWLDIKIAFLTIFKGFVNKNAY